MAVISLVRACSQGSTSTTPNASNGPRVSSQKGTGKASWTSGFRKVSQPAWWGIYLALGQGINCAALGQMLSDVVSM